MIFLSTIFISSIQLQKAKFPPDGKHYTRDDQFDIQCEIIHSNEYTDSPQLCDVDLRIGKRTIGSRRSIISPVNDTSEVFKQSQNWYSEYIRKNRLHITSFHLGDSTQYQCDCPNCEEHLDVVRKNVQLMKLAEPIWEAEPIWAYCEHMKTIITCTADDFCPYVVHRIIRSDHLISHVGESVLSNNNTYSQRFSWEADSDFDN
jgi:hypothetical protein